MLLPCLTFYFYICETASDDSNTKQNDIYIINYCNDITSNKEIKQQKRKYESSFEEDLPPNRKQNLNRSEALVDRNEERTCILEENVKLKNTKISSHFKMKEILPKLAGLNIQYFVHQDKFNRSFIKSVIPNNKLANIVLSDVLSLSKWKEVVNIFIIILNKYYKFSSSENFEFNILDREITVEDLDSYLSEFLLNMKTVKLDIPQNELNRSLLYTRNINFFLSQERFNINIITNILYNYSNILSLGTTIKDLIVLLLHKIKTNRIVLDEIISVILTVFYQYPTEEYEINDAEYVEDLKLFISKIIILIDVANYAKYSDKTSKMFIRNVNHMIARSLIIYYTKNNTQSRLYRILNKKLRVESLIEANSALRLPISPEDMIFMDFILAKHTDIVKNFCEPVLILKYNEKLNKNYYKLGYSYLIKAIENLYNLGYSIIDNLN
ncbi:hypothetical protein NGRA_0487 [Nosema granulosis]|uniref:Uncharacterized protein n=1 Tax=Nosema granulosis TaxID=83296 RepID=A0A9P6H1A6_9MICR|nr:hypothetical protein NGRA_0487 [Nosema granulosis]